MLTARHRSVSTSCLPPQDLNSSKCPQPSHTRKLSCKQVTALASVSHTDCSLLSVSLKCSKSHSNCCNTTPHPSPTLPCKKLLATLTHSHPNARPHQFVLCTLNPVRGPRRGQLPIGDIWRGVPHSDDLQPRGQRWSEPPQPYKQSSSLVPRVPPENNNLRSESRPLYSVSCISQFIFTVIS